MSLIQKPYLFPSEIGFNSWWDFNNTDKAGTQLTAGASVLSLSDFCFGGNNLAQATGANQPTYLINSSNGNNAGLFSGNQYLQVANSAANNPNTNMIIFCVGTLANAGVGSSFIFMSKYNNWFAGFYQQRALLTQGGVTDYLTTSAVIAINTPFSYLARFYSTGGGSYAVDFYINEEFVETRTGGIGVSSSNPFYLGGWRGDTTQNWDGRIMTAGIRFSDFSETWQLPETLKFLKFRRGA